jgi:hypothetical protein
VAGRETKRDLEASKEIKTTKRRGRVLHNEPLSGFAGNNGADPT